MIDETLRDEFAKNPNAYFLVGRQLPDSVSQAIGSVAVTDGYDSTPRPLGIPDQAPTYSN